MIFDHIGHKNVQSTKKNPKKKGVLYWTLHSIFYSSVVLSKLINMFDKLSFKFPMFLLLFKFSSFSSNIKCNQIFQKKSLSEKLLILETLMHNNKFNIVIILCESDKPVWLAVRYYNYFCLVQGFAYDLNNNRTFNKLLFYTFRVLLQLLCEFIN